MPLDQYVGSPARTMSAPPSDDGAPPVQQEVQSIVDATGGRPSPLGGVERFAFYEAAKSSYAVVLTSERRLYGNFLLKKGVVPPEH